MKCPKSMLLVTLLVGNLTITSPINAICWNIFNWDTFKKQTLAVGSILSLSLVSYWTANKFKNYNLFSDPKINQPSQLRTPIKDGFLPEEAQPNQRIVNLEKKLAAKLEKINVSYGNFSENRPTVTQQNIKAFDNYCNAIENDKLEDDLTLKALAKMFQIKIEKTNLSTGSQVVFDYPEKESDVINIWYNPYTRCPYATTSDLSISYRSQCDLILKKINFPRRCISTDFIRKELADYIRNNPELKAEFMAKQ